MARLYIAGCETDFSSSIGSPERRSHSGTITRDTAIKRSGAASWKFDSTAGNVAANVNLDSAAAYSAATTYFFRFYMRFAALPSSSVVVFTLNAGWAVRLTSGGKLQLIRVTGSTQVGSDSTETIAVDTWHRIELMFIMSSGSQGTDAELRLNGTTVAIDTGQTMTGMSTPLFGWTTAPGASKVMYMDDYACGDSTGADNNTWIGASNIIMMLPISDNNRGVWTAGAGGTTSLFDAVNNFPPAGLANASATNTSQIKILSTSLPSNCDLNLDTYLNAGVPAGSLIESVMLCAVSGEDPATGTKAGTIESVSNPASGASPSFNFGLDAGLQGTYAGLWAWHRHCFSVSTQPTLSTAPVIRITCTSGSTGTRAASCCYLGMYVEYSAAAVVDSPPPIPIFLPEKRLISQLAMRRSR